MTNDIMINEFGMVQREGRWWTTSLAVADKFKKQHRDVLRTVRELECSAEFRLRNFAQSSYSNSQGRSQPAFEVTRDGFTILAMGFTGKEAMKWKEQYINLFNVLEKQAMEVVPAISKQLADNMTLLSKSLLLAQKGQFEIEGAIEVISGDVVVVKTKVGKLENDVSDIKHHLSAWYPRRELKAKDKKTHRYICDKNYGGRCPCCHDAQILDTACHPIIGVLEYDHWYGNHKAGLTETWPVCRTCNHGVLKKGTRHKKNHAFLQYQEILELHVNPQSDLFSMRQGGCFHEND